ncbi:MAG: DUF1926 domain-containing protein [Candidatus Omnitrophica bacterium]|nr:DUF1926 domain-containing protein [Candidatus Omnitrophota bacterium]
MNSVLLLTLHFHQPVGNFDSVVERVHDDCYRPFLDTVASYPAIKFNMHLSGSLLDWFLKNRPETIALIKGMVAAGNVELVGGAIYEPVFSTIPRDDLIGQIDMMRRMTKDLFKRDFKSAWIPERVWEPHLVTELATAGIENLVLDDTHFLYAGITKDRTYGYYISEDNGNTVRIFASDKPLRYTIPFRPVEESLKYMKDVTSRIPDAVFMYGDDVEKFGEWPGTHKLVYEDGWLKEFLDCLEKNKAWLSTETIGECVESRGALGRVYLPTASYEEMLEWALPLETRESYQKIKRDIENNDKTEEYLPFIRGGFFRNFFSKYYESNQMHKRMLYVSSRLRKAKGKIKHKDLFRARRELYKGQCNCAYWHGMFGGVYLYHLRRSVYENLLKAEEIMNRSLGGKIGEAVQVNDFDGDGSPEVIMQNRNIWMCAKPSSGGTIIEFDARETHCNILNIMTRYREYYHKDWEEKEQTRMRSSSKTQPDSNPKEVIKYDTFRKAAFTDYLLDGSVNLEDFEKGRFTKSDFPNAPFDFKVKNGRLVMERKTTISDSAATLRKEFSLHKNCLKAKYVFEEASVGEKSGIFGVELPFIMPDANSFRYVYRFNDQTQGGFGIESKGATPRVRKVLVFDQNGGFNLEFTFSEECDIWRFPIKTVSRFERGYEEIYQGSVIFARWELSRLLSGGREIRIDLKLS